MNISDTGKTCLYIHIHKPLISYHSARLDFQFLVYIFDTNKNETE